MAKKILFIENTPNIQKQIEKTLVQEGFEIIAASDGEKGLELIKQEQPSLILLDLILPKKDGLEIIKEIKQDENLKNIPAILLIDVEQISDIEQILSFGAVTYLVKEDFKAEDILTKIKQILKHE